MDPRDPQRRHLPSHDVFKVRTVLHMIGVLGLLERAENALSVSREYFQGPDHGQDAVEDTLGKYLRLWITSPTHAILPDSVLLR